MKGDSARPPDPTLTELREAYESGNLVIFAGAGLSAAAGLPGWKKLVDLLSAHAQTLEVPPAQLHAIAEARHVDHDRRLAFARGLARKLFASGATSATLNEVAALVLNVHLCGHVHVATARALRDLGKTRDSLRLVAGASHGESSEEHGYAWGALRWNKGYWELGWAPRIFTRSEGMVADRNRYKLGDEGFAWEPLARLKWSPPSS